MNGAHFFAYRKNKKITKIPKSEVKVIFSLQNEVKNAKTCKS